MLINRYDGAERGNKTIIVVIPDVFSYFYAIVPINSGAVVAVTCTGAGTVVGTMVMPSSKQRREPRGIFLSIA